MCKFFSMCSDGNGNPIYFDWSLRKKILAKEIDVESPDSHTSIATYFGHKGKKEDKLNKYEYNPLTKVFTVDQINITDDKCLVERWVKGIDFRTITPHLNLFPIKNPLEKKSKKITKKELLLLKEWASIWASVRDSVRDSVRASVGASVGASVWAYQGSFFKIPAWKYIKHVRGKYPYAPVVKLWESGLVPSFDGTNWRLHGKPNAKILYTISADDLRKWKR